MLSAWLASAVCFKTVPVTLVPVRLRSMQTSDSSQCCRRYFYLQTKAFELYEVMDLLLGCAQILGLENLGPRNSLKILLYFN